MRANPVIRAAKAIARGVLPARVQARVREIIYPAQQLVPTEELERVYRRAVAYLRDGTDHPVGDYLEFGVYRGDSLLCMDRVRRELGLSFRLFGFDSLQGLPKLEAGDRTLAWTAGAFPSNYKRTQKRLEQAGLDTKNAALIKGWYKDTLTPELVRRYNLVKASTIMIDCDLYSSTRTALDFCAPLIKDEAIVFFDDWDGGQRLADRGEGEARAFAEFLQLHPEFAAEEFDTYYHTEFDPPVPSKVFRISRLDTADETASAQA
jgi:O-methyltransferase